MDIITYALCKKLAASAASGIKNLEIRDTTLIITTNDDQILEMTFPTPENGISIETVQIDEKGNLICYLSDGSFVDAGKVVGEPGYTPIKGKDYFTEEDIDEIVKIILDTGVTGEGVSTYLLYEGETGGTPDKPAEGTILYTFKNALTTDFSSDISKLQNELDQIKKDNELIFI